MYTRCPIILSVLIFYESSYHPKWACISLIENFKLPKKTVTSLPQPYKIRNDVWKLLWYVLVLIRILPAKHFKSKVVYLYETNDYIQGKLTQTILQLVRGKQKCCDFKRQSTITGLYPLPLCMYASMFCSEVGRLQQRSTLLGRSDLVFHVYITCSIINCHV